VLFINRHVSIRLNKTTVKLWILCTSYLSHFTYFRYDLYATDDSIL